MYVKEAQIVDQFSNMLAPLALTDAQATKILTGLSRRQEGSQKRSKNERQRIATRLGQLDNWSNQSYLDKLEGAITTEKWKSVSTSWDAESIHLQAQLDALNGDGPDVILTAQRILELAQKLPTLWDSRNNNEKREVVDLLYWNCTLDGANLCATYNKPFSFIAEGTQTQKWRALRDEFRNWVIENAA